MLRSVRSDETLFLPRAREAGFISRYQVDFYGTTRVECRIIPDKVTVPSSGP